MSLSPFEGTSLEVLENEYDLQCRTISWVFLAWTNSNKLTAKKKKERKGKERKEEVSKRCLCETKEKNRERERESHMKPHEKKVKSEYHKLTIFPLRNKVAKVRISRKVVRSTTATAK